jgi:hypothetical protein
MERGSAPHGHDEHEMPPSALEALAGLDTEIRQAITEIIVLHVQFPAWAVWPPRRGRSWTAIRPASSQLPGPDLPMIWVHAATASELGDQMRRADVQLTAGER